MKREENKWKKGYWNYYPTEKEWWGIKVKSKMRPASVHETMGPHWKDIIWSPHPKMVNKRPYIIIAEK